MTCTHIVGTGDDFGEISLIHSGDDPYDASCEVFHPFSFCPLCGAEVTSLASEFQSCLDALKKQERDSAPSEEEIRARQEALRLEEIRKDREYWDSLGLSHVQIPPPTERDPILNYFLADLVRGVEIGSERFESMVARINLEEVRKSFDARPMGEHFRRESGAICCYAKNHSKKCRISQDKFIIKMELLP